MAFVRANLERVAGGAKKLFIYDSGADAAATVAASGYFNDIADEVDAGDAILAFTGGGTTKATYHVTSAREVTPVTVI